MSRKHFETEETTNNIQWYEVEIDRKKRQIEKLEEEKLELEEKLNCLRERFLLKGLK